MSTGVVEPGRRYRFRLIDIICPDCRQAQQQITADLEVSGEVVFLSDRGGEPDRFAIVDVEGILSPLVVPVECLHSSAGTAPERTGESAPLQGG